ncbi:MAG TPA: hypothetical protein VMM36_05330 [Opitutaceae bacterium]|nr:hypothetical protein [Opitutaceae bacterium]
MSRPSSRGLRCLAVIATLATVLFTPRLAAAVSKDAIPVPEPAKVPAYMPDDGAAVWLAMRCAEGGDDARPALVAALDRMGWGVKDGEDNLVRAPAIAEPTGLAMRDYEIEAVFWNADLQPGMRLISYTRALAVAMPAADPEELAQGLLDSIREGAESSDPQRRFWARFIIALGMAQGGDDLLGQGEPLMMPPDTQALQGMMPKMPDEIPDIPEDASDAEKIRHGMAIAARMMNQGGFDMAALTQAAAPKTMWPLDDPVLGRTPPPESGSKTAEERLDEAQQQLLETTTAMMSADPATVEAATRKMSQLSARMTALNEAIQVANASRMLKSNDPDYEGDEIDDDNGSRFMAEHRSTPLSMLQIALITRVLVAELLALPTSADGSADSSSAPRIVSASLLPLPRWLLAQAPAGAAPSSVSGQIASFGADPLVTTGKPFLKEAIDKTEVGKDVGKRLGLVNTVMGWLKTVMMLAKSKITLEVENTPLVRTKNKTPGEQRRVKCIVEIDFPKNPEGLKVVRELMKIASLDLEVPEGGRQEGAQVAWRIIEGGAGNRYETAGGDSVIRPDLAVVKFASRRQGAAPSSVNVSTTNQQGEAFIEIEGEPQKKVLPTNVRPKARRAAIAVDVTMKVADLTRDMKEAAAAGNKGNPGLIGIVTMISEMIQRSSLFFKKGKDFPVTDWALPAWEGRIEIKLRAGGNKNEPGQKGGPDAAYSWGMNREMIAYLQTPEWDQEEAAERGIDSSNRIRLEVTEATTPYRINDFSTSHAGSVETAFTAEGPVDKPRPAQGGGPTWQSKAEPSGYATLTIWPETDPPRFSFEVDPSFYVKAHIFHFVKSGRSSNTTNEVRSFGLLAGINASSWSDSGTFDPSSGNISGRVRNTVKGYLPDVPEFDVSFEFEYQLHYQTGSSSAPQ